eukprot:TRINITY_DN1501_c0_g1_i6.p2 TRINITY_DN1501_c0_g1~~TRINITY_DN1501_c0_g1_i6.p2  ORF type:complete len:161 (-),score=28.07 TRINITY_DN1501_c0_g1_i6:218-700(-)
MNEPHPLSLGQLVDQKGLDAKNQRFRLAGNSSSNLHMELSPQNHDASSPGPEREPRGRKGSIFLTALQGINSVVGTLKKFTDSPTTHPQQNSSPSPSHHPGSLQIQRTSPNLELPVIQESQHGVEPSTETGARPSPSNEDILSPPRLPSELEIQEHSGEQ